MEKKTKKYDAILEASRKLFYKYGLRKVTIEEICTEAKVSKMTFYKYFPNKIDLAKTMFDTYIEHWLGKYKEVMYSDISFPEKMDKFLKIKIDVAKDASRDFIIDLYQNPMEDFKDYMEQWKAKAKKETIEMFTYAQQKEWMRKDLKPELMLLLIDKIYEIVMNEEFTALYDEVSDLTNEITKFFLYGVSGE